jgi:hypothetical protein
MYTSIKDIPCPFHFLIAMADKDTIPWHDGMRHPDRNRWRVVHDPVRNEDYMEVQLTKGWIMQACGCHLYLKDATWWVGCFERGAYNRACAMSSRGSAATHETLYYHRFVLPNAKEVDHRDGDALNNRCYNLFSVSHAENTRNHVMFGNNKSGFNGVSWDGKNRGYRVIWQEAAYVKRGKRFAVKKFRREGDNDETGKKRAFDAACEFRVQKDADAGFIIRRPAKKHKTDHSDDKM